MNVQEISALHQRYVDLSHRFRAAWVYHQFAQSLKKISSGSAGEGHAVEFQELYTELKEVSQALTASETERTRQRLGSIVRRLDELSASLIEEDNRVSPKELRQFFHRFPRYDEKILLQLARFVVCAALQEGWSADRVDKLDYLLTRIGQREVEGQGTFVLGEQRKLREIFESLWTLADAGDPPAGELEEHQRQLGEIRARVEAITSLDEIHQRDVLAHYRDFKHRLGPLMLEPGLLTGILATNLTFKNLVRRLYHKEERRIFGDYQRIFELEGEVSVDLQLARELGDFRREIELFEKRLQQNDFRLEELARIRGQVRSLLPRLQAASQPAGGSEGPVLPEASAPAPSFLISASEGGDGQLFADEYSELLETLEETDPDTSPQAVRLKPAIFALRLEPREVTAYRRLAGQDGSGPMDPELERFLLQAAALRVHVNRLVEEVKELLSDSTRDLGAPVYGRARECLRVADEFCWRYGSRLQHLLMEGHTQDARALEVLKMRLVRDYAGLWLMVYKPMLEASS